MKDKKVKEKKNAMPEKQEVDRRRFIEKSARDIGACGFALFELAKTIKNEIIQEIVDDIKNTVRKA